MGLLERARERFFPTDFQKMVRKFYAEGGEVSLRYDYPLTKDSVVLDLGGYRGDWAAKIHERYGSTVYVFEPIKPFAEVIERRFAGNPTIKVIAAGLGGKSRTDTIYLRDNDSSAFRPSNSPQIAGIIEMDGWLREYGIDQIALAKLNIEGAEYELLDHMLERGIHARCRDIQVQFHDLFPDAGEHMERIGKQLSATHELTYDYRFVWQNWRRKT